MPVYDLQQVQETARKGSILYRGRKVQRDVANLGYAMADIRRCLLALGSHHFQRSHQYADKTYDAYVMEFPNPLEELQVDTLYLKFCLVDKTLFILLGSFHL